MAINTSILHIKMAAKGLCFIVKVTQTINSTSLTLRANPIFSSTPLSFQQNTIVRPSGTELQSHICQNESYTVFGKGLLPSEVWPGSHPACCLLYNQEPILPKSTSTFSKSVSMSLIFMSTVTFSQLHGSCTFYTEMRCIW